MKELTFTQKQELNAYLRKDNYERSTYRLKVFSKIMQFESIKDSLLPIHKQKQEKNINKLRDKIKLFIREEEKQEKERIRKEREKLQIQRDRDKNSCRDTKSLRTELSSDIINDNNSVVVTYTDTTENSPERLKTAGEGVVVKV